MRLCRHAHNSSRDIKEQRLEESNTARLEEDFRASLPLPERLDPHFEAALLHVLENPGSLVRPRMVLQMGEAYGLVPERAKPLAIALEYFHTASLLFDDLPCMDDAAERRGVPCAHIQFGENGAILTALALINRAYALVWRSMAGCAADTQPQLIAYLEDRLGVAGLLNGQSLDLNYSSLPHTHEITERIALGKTVSLIRLTLVLPALLAGAPAREIQLLERIAIFWGLSYQSVDDLKDVLASTATAGKTVAHDILLDRPNIAGAIGVSAAVVRLNRLLALGDRTLHLLLLRRPSLSFLATLRSDLQGELMRVTENACEMSE